VIVTSRIQRLEMQRHRMPVDAHVRDVTSGRTIAVVIVESAPNSSAFSSRPSSRVDRDDMRRREELGGHDRCEPDRARADDCNRVTRLDAAAVTRSKSDPAPAS
jgi:hypothetical protein